MVCCVFIPVSSTFKRSWRLPGGMKSFWPILGRSTYRSLLWFIILGTWNPLYTLRLPFHPEHNLNLLILTKLLPKYIIHDCLLIGRKKVEKSQTGIKINVNKPRLWKWWFYTGGKPPGRRQDIWRKDRRRLPHTWGPLGTAWYQLYSKAWGWTYWGKQNLSLEEQLKRMIIDDVYNSLVKLLGKESMARDYNRFIYSNERLTYWDSRDNKGVKLYESWW